MKCQRCQTENPAAMKFCGGCGAKLERICLKCNFSDPVVFRFCGKCGNALEELQPAIPIDYSKPKSYTPKFLADKILTTRSSIEGERKLVTVLFADVANYTSIRMENLAEPGATYVTDETFKIGRNLSFHPITGILKQRAEPSEAQPLCSY